VRCSKVIEETREILELLGIDDRRLRLKWISASEGAAFADEIRLFVELLTELGENPLKNHGDGPSDLQTIGP
jgi:coenzyme F420-reducing hydrogenase delta subunit